MNNNKNGHFRLAGRPADYKRLGIVSAAIARFEDGQRIDTRLVALAFPPNQLGRAL